MSCFSIDGGEEKNRDRRVKIRTGVNYIASDKLPWWGCKETAEVLIISRHSADPLVIITHCCPGYGVNALHV